jgi:N-acetylglucosaminyldiphosphoundecaprenol N-acetyl-beta-D-mannosaminyltransferase
MAGPLPFPPRGCEPLLRRHSPSGRAVTTTETTEAVLGFPVHAGQLDDLVSEIASWVRRGDRCRWLACMNPGSYAIAMKRPGFAQALRASDWLIPDGVGIVLASMIGEQRIRQRITGSDVFERLCATLETEGGRRVFFLGATEETLAAIRERLAVDYPRLVVAGTYSPPFRETFSSAENEAMLEAIRRARPEVLWVGMTSPKQDLWIRDNLNRLDVKFAAGIGAVFDFYSGRIPRASGWVRRLGMEWVVRAAREPHRMWRRPVFAIPLFLWHLAAERLLGVHRSLP